MTTPIEPMEAVKVLREAATIAQEAMQDAWTYVKDTGVDLTYHKAGMTLRDALAATAQVEAPTSEPTLDPDGAFALGMLADLSRMGASPAGLSLAAQLFGVGPCSECGYRKLYCRCAAPQALPATEQEGGWRHLFFGVARILHCLPSQFLDGNGHVLSTASRAISALKLNQSSQEKTDRVTQLEDALRHIECEPINAEYLARAAFDGAHVSPAKPDLSGLNRATIIEVLRQYQMAHSVETIADALLAAQAKPGRYGLEPEAIDSLIDSTPGINYPSRTTLHAFAHSVVRALLATHPVAQAKPDAGSPT